MRRLVSILCCLLLVFSAGRSAMVYGDVPPTCHGCGCAAATCCSTGDESGDPSPAIPFSRESGGLQKWLASGATTNRVSWRPAEREPLPCRDFADRVDVAVPAYLRHGRLLI